MRECWELPDVRATERLGAALAEHCPWGATGARCLFLSGELGAGKTTLTAAIFHSLGVREAVRSPSYALLESYVVTAGQAVHLDLYRLHDAQELELLGLRDYLQPHTLLVIEWPERLHAALPPPDLWARLEPAGDARLCCIDAHSGFGEAWLALVEKQLARSEVI